MNITASVLTTYLATWLPYLHNNYYEIASKFILLQLTSELIELAVILPAEQFHCFVTDSYIIGK